MSRLSRKNTIKQKEKLARRLYTRYMELVKNRFKHGIYDRSKTRDRNSEINFLYKELWGKKYLFRYTPGYHRDRPEEYDLRKKRKQLTDTSWKKEHGTSTEETGREETS